MGAKQRFLDGYKRRVRDMTQIDKDNVKRAMEYMKTWRPGKDGLNNVFDVLGRFDLEDLPISERRNIEDALIKMYNKS